MTKICSICKNRKSLKKFPKATASKDGTRSWCSVCYRDYQRRFRKTDKGRSLSKIYHARWLETHPGAKERFKALKNAWVRGPGRFKQARNVATRVRRKWSISKKLYLELVSQLCEYCGGRLPETGVGLDRLDNSLGYIPDNVVPCCTICNLSRRDHFTPKEMKQFIGPAIRAIREVRTFEWKSIVEEDRKKGDTLKGKGLY